MAPTIHCQGLTWVCYDISYKGEKPRLSWCADGDGFLTVHETPEGNKLFDQTDFVKILDSNLEQAISEATQFMQENDKTMYEYLTGKRQTRLHFP